jgi:glutathione S-transferase
VDELLADGRPFICGHRFTAADLTFAALGGPMVSPQEYAIITPSFFPFNVIKTLQGQHTIDKNFLNE